MADAESAPRAERRCAGLSSVSIRRHAGTLGRSVVGVVVAITVQNFISPIGLVRKYQYASLTYIV